jgi:hypothetical protein
VLDLCRSIGIIVSGGKMSNPTYKPDLGNGNWYETTEEYHGEDREYSQDTGEVIIIVGGKGKHWDVWAKHPGGRVEKIIGTGGCSLEMTINMAENYFNLTGHSQSV